MDQFLVVFVRKVKIGMTCFGLGLIQRSRKLPETTMRPLIAVA